MTPTEILPTLCDMAVTIAGFTAIVVSIRARHTGNWNIEERIRILGVLAICGVVAVCAVLPFAISGFAIEERFNWAIPLLISGLACLVTFSLVVRAGLKGNFEFLIPWVTWTMMGLLSFSSVLSVLSGLGILLPYSPGLLVLQLVSMLVGCSITIVVTLAITYRRVGSE